MREYKFNRTNITNKMSQYIVSNDDVSKKAIKLRNYFRNTPIFINTYHDLVVEIAELACLNPDMVLFYRGQDNNFINNENITLFPSIFRKNKINIQTRFNNLELAAQFLVEEIMKMDKKTIRDFKDVLRIKKIQYAILQHYEVCDTPFLDVTQSIKVACSFAIINKSVKSYFYVLALPYVNGRISIDSEEDIVNLRLLNICPPLAKRPFFQEAFLVGSEFTTYSIKSNTNLDFRNRLIAIYEFDNTIFWNYDGSKEKEIDKSVLLPKNDSMISVCKTVKDRLDEYEKGNIDIILELVESIKNEKKEKEFIDKKNNNISFKNQNSIISYFNAVNLKDIYEKNKTISLQETIKILMNLKNE